MAPITGAWQLIEQSWHNVQVINCQVCGRLIPRRIWRFADKEFGSLDSCGATCERLWFEYLRERRLADRK